MVRLYLVMLHMSINLHHLGGYELFFKPTPYVIVGHSYNVKLFGYVWRAWKISTLAFFHKIRSAFHPEAGKYAVVTGSIK